MHEFDCEACGIHVIAITGEPNAENVLCQTCRWIESIEDDKAREEAREFLRMIDRTHDQEHDQEQQ